MTNNKRTIRGVSVFEKKTPWILAQELNIGFNEANNLLKKEEEENNYEK